MGLIRKLFWFVMFLGFALVWVTILEHGTDDFTGNVQKEIEYFKGLAGQKIERAPDTSDSPEGKPKR